jgi:hypothetical protein
MLGLLVSKSSQESGANDNDNVLPKHVCLRVKCSSQRDNLAARHTSIVFRPVNDSLNLHYQDRPFQHPLPP